MLRNKRSLLEPTLLIVALLTITSCQRASIEDFHQPGNEDRFIKLDNKGQPLDAKAGIWRCVRDPANDLVWEVKTDNEGLHDYQWTYSWDGASTDDQRASELRDMAPGSCDRRSTERCTTTGLIAATNAEQLCGFQDWRLPTQQELQTLFDQRELSPNPKICKCWFPRTQRSGYWSADMSSSTGQISAVNFVQGKADSFHPRTFFAVRLVRGSAEP